MLVASVNLASPRYEAEDRVDMRTARHLICQGTLTKTRQAQKKLCQRQEPLWALRIRSPGFTSVPELFSNPEALWGSPGLPAMAYTVDGHGP